MNLLEGPRIERISFNLGSVFLNRVGEKLYPCPSGPWEGGEAVPGVRFGGLRTLETFIDSNVNQRWTSQRVAPEAVFADGTPHL